MTLVPRLCVRGAVQPVDPAGSIDHPEVADRIPDHLTNENCRTIFEFPFSIHQREDRLRVR